MARQQAFGVAALAAATLLLETTLTRLLAVAQFYHFAFLVVSLALLGFGASGSVLSLWPRLRAMTPERLLARCGIGFTATAALAYLAVNALPFDSYSIAWDPQQILYFVLYYAALVLPFLCAGIGIGAALAVSQGPRHLLYAANLLGSALGALLAPAALEAAGVPGAVLVSALIGLLPAMSWPPRRRIVACLMTGLACFAVLAGLNLSGQGPLGLVLSPYKGLSYAWRYPGARELFGRWSDVARVDVVAQAGTHLLPGLSYAYAGTPPEQYGLSLDADSLQPITLARPEEFAAASYQPEAIAFELRPDANSLVLEPGGGLGVLQALAGGARTVTAVIGNPLVREAIARATPEADIYSHPRVRSVIEAGRVFLRQGTAGRQNKQTYDVVFLPLTDAYRPVTSGAYSLAESYLLTTEAFEDALSRLGPDGILVTTRWLQTPPSESVRLLTTEITALERQGAQPARALIAYRGIQTITTLVKPSGWTENELARTRAFLESRRYDLVWAPDIKPEETNRFNRLAEPADFQIARSLLAAPERDAFYNSYPFAVAPATDDHPFFFHFFTWSQTPHVLETIGHTWQPFGGSGYFVLLALLALVLLLSTLLVGAPLLLRSSAAPLLRVVGLPTRTHALRQRISIGVYFSALGLAFLFVEIPLIQRWILLLGYPTYAFAGVVLTLLLFSALGSAVVHTPRLPHKALFGALVLLALLTPLVTARLSETVLGWPLLLRVIAGMIALAPLATLMGMPFPLGLAWLETEAPGLIPWAWAVNGCASVIASVLAAMLALSFGFSAVLMLGGAAYALAWLLFVLRTRGRVLPGRTVISRASVARR